MISIPKPKKSDPNNIYYNIRIVNDGKDLFKVANYQVTRTSPIVEDPSNYELAVVRFSIPGANIPVMVWGSGVYNPISNPSSKVQKFSVSMTYDGFTVTKFLTFIPNSSGNDFYGDAIWVYQELLDQINVAFTESFTDLKTAKPLAPPTVPPRIIYNARTSLCTLLGETLYDTGTPGLPASPPTIAVYFNSALFSLFQSLQSFEQEEKDPLSHRLLIKDTFDNNFTVGGLPHYAMEQEFSTLALWNDFSTIIFETDTIPVEPEYQPTINDTTRRLITDFQPIEGINNRELFQYFGAGWKRYYDLSSSYPLREIDIKTYWEDKHGTSYPIYLGSGDSLTMKLLFRRKLPLQLSESLGLELD